MTASSIFFALGNQTSNIVLSPNSAFPLSCIPFAAAAKNNDNSFALISILSFKAAPPLIRAVAYNGPAEAPTALKKLLAICVHILSKLKSVGKEINLLLIAFHPILIVTP